MTAEEKTLLQKYHRRLPGNEKRVTLEKFQQVLNTYAGIDAQKLRSHLIYFLQQVIPVAGR